MTSWPELKEKLLRPIEDVFEGQPDPRLGNAYKNAGVFFVGQFYLLPHLTRPNNIGPKKAEIVQKYLQNQGLRQRRWDDEFYNVHKGCLDREVSLEDGYGEGFFPGGLPDRPDRETLIPIFSNFLDQNAQAILDIVLPDGVERPQLPDQYQDSDLSDIVIAENPLHPDKTYKQAFTEEDLKNLKRRVAELQISAFSISSLGNAGYVTVWDIIKSPQPKVLQALNYQRKNLQEVKGEIEELGFAIDFLPHHREDLLSVDISDRSSLERLGLIEPDTKADPLKDWIREALPERLQNGLTPEFLESVLNAPEVRRKVQQVVADAVAAQLGLNKVN